MKIDAQILDKKIELIQWLSSLEDKVIIDKLLHSEKLKQKIGGKLLPMKKEPLFKKELKMPKIIN